LNFIGLPKNLYTSCLSLFHRETGPDEFRA